MSDTEVPVSESVNKKAAKDLEVAAVENKVNGEPENTDNKVNSNGDTDSSIQCPKRKRVEEPENKESGKDLDPGHTTEKRMKMDGESTNNLEKETNGESDSAGSEDGPTKKVIINSEDTPSKTDEELTCKNDSDQSKEDSVSNLKENESDNSNNKTDGKEDAETGKSIDLESKSDKAKTNSDKSVKEEINTDVKKELNEEEKLCNQTKAQVKNNASTEASSMEVDHSEDHCSVDRENKEIKLENTNESGTGSSATETRVNTTSVIKTVVKGANGEETLNENKSIDSDKENVESPMDLSKPGKAQSSPDVIMLSDEDEEVKMNGFVGFNELTPVQQIEQKRIIRKLQEELRNEEAKLVLLKKLRQSQVMQHFQEGGQTSQSPATNKVPPSRSANTAPPPLVRGGGQPLTNSKDTRNMPPQLVRHPSQQSHQRSHSGNQGPPPLVMAPSRSNVSSGRSLHSSQQGTSNPPNLVQGYSRQAQQPPPQPEQTPAQRQAAAKLALRKQLEKTLLQIPPPKPPPPEMNFIPSLAGNEFICLVGLEEVVKHITESDAKSKGEKTPEVKYVFNPFVCVQCGTDFTPVWKRDKPGSKNVICEQCVTSNQKKALKQEHTNRLKSAFVKALQQEQEIEQRMQSQAATTSSSSSSSNAATTSSTTPTTTSHHSGSHSLPMAGLANFSNASYTSPMNLSTGFKPSQDQIRQHQNLIQAHQAQLRAAVPLGFQFNPRLAFPYQAAPISNKAAADLQRQYLLDMINPGRSNQNTLHWKS